MCGIHLILDQKNNLAPQQLEALHNMLLATSHRGPDSSSTLGLNFGSGRLHLGCNRLKIIDPHQRADQPMRTADGRYSLCFNGTIYNYFELRNRLLGQGAQFSTQSDTEVLLHMLIRQGKGALEELNGMFALIFYDAQQERLLVARDRFGMKPLYFFSG
jgi:asparagine synthase (glutamine-hydrolysing)